MEALKADVTQGLEKGSLITCADNTGARELRVISVAGYSGVKNRHPKAGLADKVTVSVTKGTPEMRRQVLEAVVVRQRKPIRDRTAFASNSRTTRPSSSTRTRSRAGPRSRAPSHARSPNASGASHPPQP
ncbi:MAG: ribosomal protein L14 [uncultured archaeon A07HN63]|nr:MAG: ribosomal protein L14 [uncultured archaeon A07HN63]